MRDPQPTTLDERIEIPEDAPLGMAQTEEDRDEHREQLESFKDDLKAEREAHEQDPTLGEPRKAGDHAGSEDGSDVPSGTVEEVKAWVGDDPDRAQQALDAERAGQNRSSLISHLEGVAGQT
jgi:hypothetical protein